MAASSSSSSTIENIQKNAAIIDKIIIEIIEKCESKTAQEIMKKHGPEWFKNNSLSEATTVSCGRYLHYPRTRIAAFSFSSDPVINGMYRIRAASLWNKQTQKK